MLELQKIRKAFARAPDSEFVVIDDATFNIPPGMICALMGPNGSGKTTLLRLLAGEIGPTSGTIKLDGKLLNDVPSFLRARLVGRVHQESYKALASELSAQEILSIASQRGRRLKLSWPSARRPMARVERFSGAIGHFLREVLTLRVEVLSGGQRQLLAIVIATLGTPRVILLDEHLSSLDERYRQAADELIVRSARDGKVCVLAVTHDIEWARAHCDAIVRIEHGRVLVSE